MTIRMQADDFFNAYLVLKDNTEALVERLQVKPSYSNSAANELGVRVTGGVDIVCLAFSVELYLKDLLSVVKIKVPREHNILKLFNKLPEDIRKEIFLHESISKNPSFTSGNILLANRFSSDFTPYDGFIEKLEEISDAFHKWRYSYESTTLKYDVSFAVDFIEVLTVVANNARKSSL